MRKLLKSKLLIIFIFFLVWRIYLLIPLTPINNLTIIHKAYIGKIPLSNFDGIHYLSIAKIGYVQYEQAFFPLFPILINFFHNFFKIDYLISGILISNIALILAMIYFWKLIGIDFDRKTVIASLLFLLFFPTSFFMGNVYSESLFLFFVISSFYYARKNKFLIASILGAFAAATRVVGIFILPAIILEVFLYTVNSNKKINIRPFLSSLIIPFGLLSYMYYLFKNYQDPILFVHSQAAFTGRSGGQIILLPQVIWRYFKILTTVSMSNYDYWIALMELLFFLVSLLILYLAYKKGIRISYILFSFLAIMFPTLSGTLLSMPRFVIAGFVIFIYFARIENTIIKYVILGISVILEGILTALFYKGYFVS